MADLIDRQVTINEIKALYEWHDTVTEDRVIDHLMRLPSAQPDVPDTNVGDMISRQAAIDVLATMQGLCTSKTALVQNSKIWQQIKDLPSADAVKVVRCKDCKWFNDIGCAIRIVDDSDKPTENDYCSFGVRKNGGFN